MPERDDVLGVVREWILKAENDLKTAVHTLALGDECPTDTVCFHAQQCVEKYVKALLVSERIDFPKTHDLERLLGLLPIRSRPRLSPEEQGRLTDYATGPRYPGWEEILLPEARKAVAVARRARKEMRRRLPSESLRPQGA
jgi:HEPN domain-containing protein